MPHHYYRYGHDWRFHGAHAAKRHASYGRRYYQKKTPRHTAAAKPSATPSSSGAFGAQSAFVVDTDGHVLYCKNPDKRVNVASVNKLCTAHLVFNALKEGKLTHKQADQLLVSMLHNSNNWAATRLGRLIAGDKPEYQNMTPTEKGFAQDRAFAEIMNKTGKQLGMTDTIFASASGEMNPNLAQHTTARDRANFAVAFYKAHAADIAKYASGKPVVGTVESSYPHPLTYPEIKGDPAFVGGKTGTGGKAGTKNPDDKSDWRQDWLGFYKVGKGKDQRVVAAGLFELPRGTYAKGLLAKYLAQNAAAHPTKTPGFEIATGGGKETEQSLIVANAGKPAPLPGPRSALPAKPPALPSRDPKPEPRADRAPAEAGKPRAELPATKDPKKQFAAAKKPGSPHSAV